MPDPAVLECRELRKSYGALRVTDDLAVALYRGEVHALIGPNGAGKTSALAQLAGELASDAGQVFLDGADVTALTLPQRVHAGIARSYQISSVFAGFTAVESVEVALQAIGGHSFRFFKPAARNRPRRRAALELLDRVGLGEVAHVKASALSHGQTRQLELAMALASDPKVLLLDEPMAGVGHHEVGRLSALIAELTADRAVLLVEHDMDVVFGLAATITVMAEGRTVASGPPDAIRSDPAVQRLYLRDDADDDDVDSDSDASVDRLADDA